MFKSLIFLSLSVTIVFVGLCIAKASYAGGGGGIDGARNGMKPAPSGPDSAVP